MLSPFGLIQRVIFLICLIEYIDFAVIVPESILLRVLFLNELIVGNIGSKEGISVSLISAFSDMTKTGTEFILRIFSRNKPTVAGYLCSRIVS